MLQKCGSSECSDLIHHAAIVRSERANSRVGRGRRTRAASLTWPTAGSLDESERKCARVFEESVKGTLSLGRFPRSCVCSRHSARSADAQRCLKAKSAKSRRAKSKRARARKGRSSSADTTRLPSVIKRSSFGYGAQRKIPTLGDVLKSERFGSLPCKSGVGKDAVLV